MVLTVAVEVAVAVLIKRDRDGAVGRVLLLYLDG